MGIVCELRQIDASEIDPLLANPDQIEDLMDPAEYGSEEQGSSVDLDKSWHAIHYLLTGTADEGTPPLSYLLYGGEDVGDIDLGYGPARVLRPPEVQSFDTALSNISSEEMRRRFNPKAMMAADIYPTIWDRSPAEDDTLGYVLEGYTALKTFIHNASEKGKGVIIYLT